MGFMSTRSWYVPGLSWCSQHQAFGPARGLGNAPRNPISPDLSPGLAHVCNKSCIPWCLFAIYVHQKLSEKSPLTQSAAKLWSVRAFGCTTICPFSSARSSLDHWPQNHDRKVATQLSRQRVWILCCFVRHTCNQSERTLWCWKFGNNSWPREVRELVPRKRCWSVLYIVELCYYVHVRFHTNSYHHMLEPGLSQPEVRANKKARQRPYVQPGCTLADVDINPHFYM